MGNSWSSNHSYLQYKNDFELVIRATKDLEYLLETQFGAPSTKQTGLHDKITHAQRSAGLSQETIKKMRYLVTIRNKMVHERGFNSLPDRAAFATSYDKVEKELRQKVAERKGGDAMACVLGFSKLAPTASYAGLQNILNQRPSNGNAAVNILGVTSASPSMIREKR